MPDPDTLPTATAGEILELSRTQWGKPYRLGAENRVGLVWYRDAAEWDCSEFTEGTFGAFGIHLPDGSGAQGDYLEAHRIPIEDAYRTPAALLGHYPSHGQTGHVVMSLGNGMSSEARGRAYGVGSWSLRHRPFTWAAVVPGVSDGNAVVDPLKPPPGSLAALMQALFYVKQIRLGPGLENPLSAMAFLRVGINHTAGRHLAETGPWDDDVANAVIDIQRITEKNELGFVGPQTWETLYPPPLPT